MKGDIKIEKERRREGGKTERSEGNTQSRNKDREK